MKVYEFTFDEDKNEFLKVSVVKDAAVETKLMAFSSEEETKPVFFANEEKREIYCVAMIPNKMIFRKDINGEPAIGYFTAESIERFQLHYFRTASNRMVNINHNETDTTGVFPFESWIVKDSTNDKSNAMNLEASNGSLVMAFKVENNEVWNECKNGNLDGLSIEAHLGVQLKSNFKTEVNMNKEEKTPENLWGILKSFFAAEPKEEEDKAVEEMATQPAPSTVEEEIVEPVEETEDPTAELKAENEMLKAEVETLKAKLATLEAEKVKAETELISMAKEAMSAQTKVNAPIEMKADTPLEKFKRNHLK